MGENALKSRRISKLFEVPLVSDFFGVPLATFPCLTCSCVKSSIRFGFSHRNKFLKLSVVMKNITKVYSTNKKNSARTNPIAHPVLRQKGITQIVKKNFKGILKTILVGQK